MDESTGQFGPAAPVAREASAQDKFMAFIGRDPSWQPEDPEIDRRHTPDDARG
ncbi:MAG: hypothetical protein ACRDXX_19235 [Stackebrandtia sp.]